LSAVYVLGDLPLAVERSAPATDDAIAEDWAQLNVHGQPLWAPSFVDHTRRITVETFHSAFIPVDGADVAVLDTLVRSASATWIASRSACPTRRIR
jgi:hypothetical protein